MLKVRVFWALLERDLLVLSRQVGGVLAQVLMQPLCLLLVFGTVLGALGYTPPGYAELLLPGLIALNAFFAATQHASFPLAMDFISGAIEDRLRTPATAATVAGEKIVAAAARGVLTALAMVPIGMLLLGGVSWPLGGVPLAVLIVLLGALTGGAVGLTIGSVVPPRRVGVSFALAMPPLLFTGSAQFPFPELDVLPWFQVICALNPMTYVSEGLRGLLTPGVAHLPVWLAVLALLISLIVFTAIGVTTFRRRAIV